MQLNLKRLKKDEILWLASNKCKHGHYYIEHLNCYINENPSDAPMYEKIGFLDIEATNLKGDYAFILSYCIKEMDGKVLGRQITTKEIRSKTYDKKLLNECIEDMKKFDRIVVYYGGDYRFDIPFLRTRAIHYGFDFPLYKECKVTDLYPIVKKKLNLHNRRMQTVCDFFGIASKAHPINPQVWFGAGMGDKKSLDWVMRHNEEDVISTELLYKKIINYVNKQNSSI